MPKIKGAELRPSMLINHKDSVLRVISTEHVKPGKGPAYLQTVMKDIVKGTKLEERFRISDPIEQVNLEVIKHQFLYKKSNEYHFISMEDYEQIVLKGDILDGKKVYLKNGTQVEVEFLGSKPVNLILPDQMTMEVTETEPVLKGQTAASSLKNATLENGLTIQVPPHVKEGNKIILDTANNSYIKKV